MRKSKWNPETIRDTAAHMHSQFNRKTGRPSDWAHSDQRRKTGRWADNGGDYIPTYDIPPRG